jgi:hypothetical protein
VRLVARGFTQRQGEDYDETFAPVTDITEILITLAVAVRNKWPVHQFDIRTAYLNAHLQHDVYMKIPTDIPDESLRGTTVKLKRALYGLKQAGFEWFSHLRETLLRLGWTSDDLFPCRYKTTRESEDYFIHSNIQRITLNAFRINTVGIVKSYCE